MVLCLYFETINGLKQGGVLSLLLFSVYLDDLFIKLTKSEYNMSDWHPAIQYADLRR